MKCLKDIFTGSGRVRASVVRAIKSGQLVLIQADELGAWVHVESIPPLAIPVPAELRSWIKQVIMAKRGRGGIKSGVKTCEVITVTGRRIYVAWDGRLAKDDAGNDIPGAYRPCIKVKSGDRTITARQVLGLAHIVNVLCR